MTPLFNVKFGIVVDINASLPADASQASLVALTIAASRYCCGKTRTVADHIHVGVP